MKGYLHSRAGRPRSSPDASRLAAIQAEQRKLRILRDELDPDDAAQIESVIAEHRKSETPIVSRCYLAVPAILISASPDSIGMPKKVAGTIISATMTQRLAGICRAPAGLYDGPSTYAYVGGNPLNYMEPYGLFGWADMPTLPQGLVNFGAGMGDVILFGQGQRLRDLLDVDGGVDSCSSEYSAGEWAGVGVSVATGFAGGLKAADVKGTGTEFSHWIPNRMGGPHSVWNGNYVPTSTHALAELA